jgi:hypothetical protein
MGRVTTLLCLRASRAQHGAGLKLAIDCGWLWKHESSRLLVALDGRTGYRQNSSLLNEIACGQLWISESGLLPHW